MVSEQTRERNRRATIASDLAAAHSGVMHRRDLARAGIDRFGVRTEVAAGRWVAAGRHTLVVGAPEPSGAGLWWRAVWESGSGSVLDGAAALLAAGLTGLTPASIDVWVPPSSTAHSVPGVRQHRYRATPPHRTGGLPRVLPEWATIHAAAWAGSDRQAALLVCLPVQQRLIAPARLMAAWRTVDRSPRRAMLDAVIGDVCDGAHSLGELDFGRWCQRYGLPQPRRQTLRVTERGRCYLDVEFDGRVVEIDGGHHLFGLSPVADALRANEFVLGADRVLRLPVLGLRVEPDAFMAQVARGLGLAAMPFSISGYAGCSGTIDPCVPCHTPLPQGECCLRPDPRDQAPKRHAAGRTAYLAKCANACDCS